MNRVPTYYFGDVETQEALLSQQLILAGPDVKARAFKSMYKRIDRFYGLNNKYLGNGKRRK